MAMTRTRDEHLDWAKARALEYLDAGDLANAVSSMGSDLGKHPELKPNAGLVVYALHLVMRHDRDGVRRWIEGFR
jgi:hypothetical protein